MISILKVGQNQYLENFEPVTLEPTAFDEQGNPTEFQERWVIPRDPLELARLMADTLVWLAKQRVQKVLEEYGYYSLGDLQVYASQNDQEAQAILSWYQAYDRAIWDYISQNFDPIVNGTQQVTVDQILKNYSDLRAIEEEIFNQSIQTSQLP